MSRMRSPMLLLTLCLLGLDACSPVDTTSDETRAALERGRELARIAADSADSVARWAATMTPRPGDVIDSALTPAEHRRRFREQYGNPPAATALANGASSRDALARQFIDALVSRDSMALVKLQVTPMEFLDLYYPQSHFSQPPYELSPQLAWMQISLNSDKGLVRVRRRFTNPGIRYVSHRCPADATPLGAGRVWEGCTVTFAVDEAAPETHRLFGGIFEYDRQFKFLGYTNSM